MTALRRWAHGNDAVTTGHTTTSPDPSRLACRLPKQTGERRVRELETSLQQFAEFILKAQLVTEKAAPLTCRICICHIRHEPGG